MRHIPRRSPSLPLLLAAVTFAVSASACQAGQTALSLQNALNVKYPKTLAELKAVLGDDYLYIEHENILFVSDLDRNTISRLVAKDFLQYKHILSQDYFTKAEKAGDGALLTVYLFKDRDSYVKGLRKAGWEIPVENESNRASLRDGFYYSSAAGRGIAINYRDNYDRGLSVYAHEITHALIMKEFPRVPEWLNEGLATMIGKSRIVNNRLEYNSIASARRVQKSLAKGQLSRLLQSTNADFAGANSHPFYDGAEQFCRFLQSRNQLLPFYRELRDGKGNDPTGAETLFKITGRRNLDDLEKDWFDWMRSQK